MLYDSSIYNISLNDAFQNGFLNSLEHGMSFQSLKIIYGHFLEPLSIPESLKFCLIYIDSQESQPAIIFLKDFNIISIQSNTLKVFIINQTKQAMLQEKLQLVFPENFQVKRVKKQIEQILQGKEKYSYDARMSFVRSQSVTFFIQFLKGALKKHKKLQSLTNFEIKIILKREYPAKAPLIFCMSDTMVNYGLEPFRDYSEFVAVDWSARFTILEVIRGFLQFVEGHSTEPQNQKKGKYIPNQSFQLDKIFSWSFLQTFPVKFVHPKNRMTNGLLVINCQNEIILLQESQNRESYLTKDLIKIIELVSIFKSRQQSSEVLLQIKSEQSQSKYSLTFKSDESENIVNYIIDYMKLANSFGKGANQNAEQQSSDEQLEDQQEQELKQSPTKTNIEEIKEEIVLYESLVESNMTSENVSNLVVLLKKAIEYYSAIGQQDFQIYLRKLKTIMSNEMAQVLLDSASENKKKDQAENSQNQNNKAAFQSIIDMI